MVTTIYERENCGGETLIVAGHVTCQLSIALGGEGDHVSFQHSAMLEYIAFLSCLFSLKPKQVVCLDSIFLQKNVMCVLPTGYGKSLIFHLVPMLLFAKGKIGDDFFRCWKSRGIVLSEAVNAIGIVVSPLTLLMSNQIS